MALAFPLDLADFWQGFRAASVSFTLGEAVAMAETGEGQVLTARVGQRLWYGSVATPITAVGGQDAVVALVDLLRDAAASFLIHDPRRAFPAADPGGAILGASAVTVAAVASNRRDVTLQGAPGGYVLSRGDHVSVQYGSGPVRYYLGRVVTGGSFAPNGTVELAPALPAGIGAGATVHLARPRLKAVMVPESFSGFARLPGHDDGFSFSWRQTLR